MSASRVTRVVFGRAIKDMRSGRVLYFRRQMGKDFAGYEWGPSIEKPPKGYTVCHNGSGHTWRAVSAGALTVMRNVDTEEQWFFEREPFVYVQPVEAAPAGLGKDDDDDW